MAPRLTGGLNLIRQRILGCFHNQPFVKLMVHQPLAEQIRNLVSPTPITPGAIMFTALGN